PNQEKVKDEQAQLTDRVYAIHASAGGHGLCPSNDNHAFDAWMVFLFHQYSPPSLTFYFLYKLPVARGTGNG
ncbi:MAG: hypothetical protein U0K37_04315, partial [Acutalibacteraceae bacterium]|nr:hypothetical protein [Acutalibacteraceae bacterium]